MTKSYQNVLLLLLMSPYLINGAPTTAPISLPANDALSTYYCNDSPAWSGPSFFPKDCATALSRFYVQEILAHENEVFEFLAIGAHPGSRYPSQHTPRKYTYGTCTMAIVMLATFHPEELPGVPPSRLFGLMDVASYSDAWREVKQVMDNCISKYLASSETMQEAGGGLNFRSGTGWSAFGSKGAIGVFVWDTNSDTNRRTHAVNLPANGLPLSYGPLQLMNSTQRDMVGTRGSTSTLLNIT